MNENINENKNKIHVTRNKSNHSNKITNYLQINKININIPKENKLNNLSNSELNKLVDKINKQRSRSVAVEKNNFKTSELKNSITKSSTTDEIDDYLLVKASIEAERTYLLKKQLNASTDLQRSKKTSVLKERNLNDKETTSKVEIKSSNIDYSQFETVVSELLKVV